MELMRDSEVSQLSLYSLTTAPSHPRLLTLCFSLQGLPLGAEEEGLA